MFEIALFILILKQDGNKPHIAALLALPFVPLSKELSMYLHSWSNKNPL